VEKPPSYLPFVMVRETVEKREKKKRGETGANSDFWIFFAQQNTIREKEGGGEKKGGRTKRRVSVAYFLGARPWREEDRKKEGGGILSYGQSPPGRKRIDIQ